MDYAVIVIRVLALFLALQGLPIFFGEVIPLFLYGDKSVSPHWTISLMNMLLPIALAIILWAFSNSLMKKSSPSSILSVLIASIGIYTFYYTFTDGWFWIIYKTMLSDNAHLPEHLSNAWIAGIGIVLSLILIFKCKTIAHFIIKVTK